MFIGFTGTPLLKADKQKSIEVFGRYIHTYKFDEAVKDKVVLDLRYEARDIDQSITSQKKIDQWFEAKTKGLTDLAKAQLKQRWGTMQKVLSSQSRLEKIVADILMDMETRDRLKSGRGNAMLVSGSIYQACKFYELFAKTDLKGKCAIVTSYRPSAADIKGEETGEGLTEKLRQYEIYQKMLADWFNEPPETAVNKVEEFEKEVKKKFIDEPGQMKLLIVVDKLLTGFDAPPATYLYIDKQMQDHGLFQAICRVNRLDGDDKEYGYIIDYKDLFKSLEGAVQDYTSGALDGYDKEDVAGLLEDRLGKARERLEEAREAVKALCEPVEPPQGHGGLPALLLRQGFRQRRAAQGQRAEAAGALQARRRRSCAPTPTWPTRWRRPATPRPRSTTLKARGGPLREGPQRGEAGQRRLHRPEDVRAGHAPPDRHLHPRRREREDLGLRRYVAGPAHRRARRRCGGCAARRHPEEQGSRGRDHREQRPQADHRRAADQPEVLREDVGAAGCPDRAAREGGARLPGVSGEDRRADQEGEESRRRCRHIRRR